MDFNFDRELLPFLDALPQSGRTDDVDATRRMLSERMGAVNRAVDTSGVHIVDERIPGGELRLDVPVRVYLPDDAAAGAGAILYIHGGAFIVGSLDTEHSNCVQLAVGLSVPVVSVDYRLAPEHPFPAGLDDCYAALLWLHHRAGSLGADAGRIAVVGNSAGGGLAAGLALLARDLGEPPICFQYLGIPQLDDRLETPSMERFVGSPVWTRSKAEHSWRLYLGSDRNGEPSPYAAPARACDLSNLPPAYVSTAENDPMRDEGILYGLRMLQAGVSVELHSFPGTWHGSRGLGATAAVSQRDLAEMLTVLRRAVTSND